MQNNAIFRGKFYEIGLPECYIGTVLAFQSNISGLILTGGGCITLLLKKLFKKYP